MYVGTDIDEAIAAMAGGSIDAAPLISPIRLLDEAPDAYAQARAPASVKVPIRMN